MSLRQSPSLLDGASADKERPTVTGASARSRRGTKQIAPTHTHTDVTSHTTQHHAHTPLQIDSLPESLNAPAASPSPQSSEPPELSTSPAPSDSPAPPAPASQEASKPGIIHVNGIDFHHASEAEFARLLNYYGIEWEYEPHQFPLQWRDGRPVEMFRPDFYLTEYDLYIELTTMRQALVRRKNRKLRLLRALYPEISIKLLYRRDYQRLLERFGIRPEELMSELPPGVDEEIAGGD